MKLEEKGGVQKCLRSNSTTDSIYNNVQKVKTTTKTSIANCVLSVTWNKLLCIQAY